MKEEKYIINYRLDNKTYEKTLTKQENIEIDRIHFFLEKIKFQLWRITEIDLNYKDLIDYINIYEEESKNKGLDNKNIQTIFINTNRLFINYITSFKYVIDYLKTSIKKYYSEESNEFILFKNLCTNSYETYFSYKLFYNLRNYCQHNNYPIYNFAEDRYYDQNGEVVYREFRIEFNKDKLLNDRTLRSKLKFELNRYGSRFPVNPLLKEILIPISKIEPLILKIYQRELVAAIKFIKSIQYKSKRTDIELRYGKVHIQNGIRHLENKIIDYNFVIELENKLKLIER